MLPLRAAAAVAARVRPPSLRRLLAPPLRLLHGRVAAVSVGAPPPSPLLSAAAAPAPPRAVCGGCGAVLQGRDVAAAGYIPSRVQAEKARGVPVCARVRRQ